MKNSLKNKPDEILKDLKARSPRVPLNVAVVGGGNACLSLLTVLDKNRLSHLNMNVLGVADIQTESPGMQYAKKRGLFTTDNFKNLYQLNGLNLLFELTGSIEVRDSIQKTKPAHLSVIDHIGARLLWDLILMETEKSALEEERRKLIRNEEKHTQVILDSLPYRTMVINLDMTVDKVNQTFLTEFNLTDAEIIGKHCYELRYRFNVPCGELGHVCYLKSHLEELKQKKSFSTIKEISTENGEDRFDVITIAPIFNENGDIVQILEASRDVTDRIKLEKEAQRSNIFLQNVIQSVVDGIVVVDTKGYPLLFNEGMERLTGYSAREITEKGHLSRFYDMDVARENMKKMRTDQHGPLGKLNPTSMSVITKDGEEIPVTLTASIILINDKEVGSVGVFTDMREILKMRKDLEEAHLQLVQSEKIASVGKMAAGVAHEINNPLSGIMIYAELLKDSLKDDTQHNKDIKEIINQTLRCKKIVSELLEFSRQSIGKPTQFNIETMIRKTLNLLINQALFQNIEVQMDIEPRLPEMMGDMGQLQQVFTNLFINAADAMEGKGRLHIEVKYDSKRHHFITTVSDTGPGIPEEHRGKIFDIFYTTKPVGRGTGLGLSISRNIIQLHGGNITLDCPQEGGTRFTIELPIGFVEQSENKPVFIGLDEE